MGTTINFGMPQLKDFMKQIWSDLNEYKSLILD